MKRDKKMEVADSRRIKIEVLKVLDWEELKGYLSLHMTASRCQN